MGPGFDEWLTDDTRVAQCKCDDSEGCMWCCDDCNTDLHYCMGCGTKTKHGKAACADCAGSGTTQTLITDIES